MSTVLLFENREYIASRDAARDSGYSLDYISKLCRTKKLNAKLIGKSWFVEKDSLELFLLSQERIKIENQKRLSRERRSDYRSARIQESAAKLGENISEAAIESARGIGVRLPAFGASALAVVVAYVIMSGTISISNLSNSAEKMAVTAKDSVANTALFIGDLAAKNPTAWNSLSENMQTAVANVSKSGKEIGSQMNTLVATVGQEAVTSNVAIGASAGNVVASLQNAGKNIGLNVYAVLLELHHTAIAYVNGLWGHMAFVAPPQREISEAPTNSSGNANGIETDKSAPASQGMVVVPSNGNANADAEQIARIQKSFSDKVSVIPAEDGESGIIRPEFKDTKGSDYVYVMVPVGGASSDSGNKNTEGTKP